MEFIYTIHMIILKFPKMNKINIKYIVSFTLIVLSSIKLFSQNANDGLGWITPGTQLTYYSMAATTGAGEILVPADASDLRSDSTSDVWRDSSGNQYTVQNSRGSGAHGFMQVTVSHITGDQAALSIKHYTINAATNQFLAPIGVSMLVQKSKADDYWISPKVLETISSENSRGVFAKRFDYTLAGHTYKAIGVRVSNDSGYTQYIYDLATGIMLHMGQCTRNSKLYFGAPDSNGVATQKSGEVQLIEVWYKGYRKVGMPWAGELPPAWVQQLNELDYQGAQYVTIPGAGRTSIPANVQVGFTNHAKGWANVVVSSQISLGYGMPPQQSQNAGVVGTSEYGSFWIPVKYLKQLSQNQILDTDSITQNRIYVMGIQNGQVGIAEAGSGFENHWYYSLTDGVMTGFETISQVGSAMTNLHLELTNRR
jgi:hypothetical protein